MEKRETIELADQIQMYIWTSGSIVFAAITIWGLIEGSGRNMRSVGVGGIMLLLCVTNLNIVLNRVSLREALRKSRSDTCTASKTT